MDGRRKKLDAAKLREIAERVTTGRKSDFQPRPDPALHIGHKNGVAVMSDEKSSGRTVSTSAVSIFSC